MLPAGVEYSRYDRPGPVVVDGVRFELSLPGLRLRSVIGPGVHGTHTVPDLALSLEPTSGVPVAAVNGDYFEFRTEPRYHGTLQGTTIVNRELVSTPAATTFWMDEKGMPHMAQARSALRVIWPDGSHRAIALNASTRDYKSEVRAAPLVLFTPRFSKSTNTEGGRELILQPADSGSVWLPLRPGQTYRARVESIHTEGNASIPEDRMVLSIARNADDQVPPLSVGDLLGIETTVSPEALEQAIDAVAGDPRLLAAGQMLPRLDTENRAPRTAVGFAGSMVWLVVVDGRQPGRSIGMTHHELAAFMLELGCTDALNLDGGGSSTLWFQGNVMNIPSGGRLRPVGNALVLTYTQP